MIDSSPIRDRFTTCTALLDERRRRSFAAAKARSAGYGGIAAVSRATGLAASTIGRGLGELSAMGALPSDRVRRPGGGRKKLVATNATLLDDLLGLVGPSERGDPMSPLRWTCKSLRRLAAELGALGHTISHIVFGELLKQQKFSLQANRKTREGEGHADRDAQFVHINARVSSALAAQQPVISVDTKKKKIVGDFKNAGRAWRPQGDPEAVRVHDFLIKQLGRAVPYGVYDIAANAGWVSVGVDHDTSAFAVQTIRNWWYHVGAKRYPEAKYLTITADGGGSNGSRVRLWKRQLQRLATELGIDIRVHHLPPGTSKWNKIEHRLFSFISMNWRARPLVSYQVIVDLIGATTTDAGLTVRTETAIRKASWYQTRTWPRSASLATSFTTTGIIRSGLVMDEMMQLIPDGSLVMLHGFPSSSHMYRNLIPALADRYHVIAPDFPGFGLSSRPDKANFEYSFAAIANLIAAFLDQIGPTMLST